MGLFDLKLREFDDKGYLIIPKFFKTEITNIFKIDFAKAITVKNDCYPVVDVSIEYKELIHKEIRPIVDLMHLKTNLKPMDTIRGAGYFSTGHGIHFPWHQDSKSYYLLQDAYNYLNLYIPIIKSDPKKSNLQIIPFDSLKTYAPEIHGKLHGRGATSVIVENNQSTLFIDNVSDSVLGKIGFDINQLALVPNLEVGDLLMIRGDILHCTQDSDTERVALSIRVCHSKSKIRKQKLIECGWYKLEMLLKNSALFLTAMKCFDEMKVDELTVAEMMDYLTQHGFHGFRQ